ncbi:exodeoxyribonuclease VII large subunit [Paenibacillus hemerocallicola]|uniref:Exodeoxyribonuclease 7 large subunit n=1 Tax=Paenibacillus hemerocallicola TaxID=1172614 RepID=A0A5C4TE90_9BACL|nr:exodeoxyribonuclease VII large subunit [Paenibacillus hemerocallicola]TNJ67338.1 exodeoxyribonuclease VII large subunit [Paenibacillus hemerocallicola]
MQNPDKVLSVKDLTRYIKMKLEGDSVLQDVWVRGELSNFTHHSSGHMYFTLKDAASRVKCIMFASNNQRLGFIPRDGSKVIARGNISVFERDGQYQMYVTHMQQDGIGNLYLAFEQLKKKLGDEGLFASERKRAIPKFPQTVGVITSPTGAAVRDIVTTLQRRYPSASILLYPVLVQGSQAAPSIARAIDAMNRHSEADVLIVGRGGGSLEELWAFNEEMVARSIFGSAIPVISAVGHETDFTIADFVADLRAATPTAAAELAVPHHLELKQHFVHLSQRLLKGLSAQVTVKKEQLNRLRRSPVLTQPRRQLQEPAQRLDRLREQLAFRLREKVSASRESAIKLERKLSAHNPKQQLGFAKKRIDVARHQLLQSMQAVYKETRHRYTVQLRQLDALSPLKVMQRGYSLAYDEKQQRIIKSVSQVQPGDMIRIRLTDGKLDCHVWGMEEERG